MKNVGGGCRRNFVADSQITSHIRVGRNLKAQYILEQRPLRTYSIASPFVELSLVEVFEPEAYTASGVRCFYLVDRRVGACFFRPPFYSGAGINISGMYRGMC